MNLNQIHIAIVDEGPIRLQDYAVGIFNTLATKSALKKAIKKNLVLVNGKIATTATFISGGETITFCKPQSSNQKSRLKLSLNVVYEDDYLAVVNKPAGILVSGNGFKTIVNALEQNLNSSTAIDAIKPQPAHRLDYATSGLLLVGKTSKALVALNKLFEEKQIEKIYYAVSIGQMNVAGQIETFIDEKLAVSNYKVVETINSERFAFLNLVKLSPKTGRRHQLRKHLNAIGNPILGDATYFLDGLLLKGKGLYLHAQSLSFTHPILNKEMHIELPLPEKFKKLFPKAKTKECF